MCFFLSVAVNLLFYPWLKGKYWLNLHYVLAVMKYYRITCFMRNAIIRQQ